MSNNSPLVAANNTDNGKTKINKQTEKEKEEQGMKRLNLSGESISFKASSQELHSMTSTCFVYL